MSGKERARDERLDARDQGAMSGKERARDERLDARDQGAMSGEERATPGRVILRDEAHLSDVLGIPFSDQQLAAVTAPLDRPAAIIAGAGSGKTAVMAARVVWLVGRGIVEPGDVLGLTFTNKAAAELAVRIRAALGLLADDAGIRGFLDELGEPTVSTYHAYAGALLSEHGLRMGFEPDLRIASDASRFQRAAQALQSHRGAIANLTTHLPTTVNDLIHLDGQLNDHLVPIESLLSSDAGFARELDVENASRKRPLKAITRARDTTDKRAELAAVIAEYREVKSRDAVMDFSDQMARGAILATESPEVSRDQRSRFAVVLLDEYQDTSVAQRMMLQGLFSGATPQAGRGHPVTAVGDPCQAIYGWRGASADNLVGFLDHFPAEDGERGSVLNLTVNRRCSTTVLDVANSLAAPLYAETDTVRPLEPRDDAPEGGIVAACLDTVVDEIDWVVRQVQAAKERDAPRWSDIAILVRTREEIGALTVALQSAEIPVEVVGMDGLLEQPEVADVLAVLDVVDSQTANASLLRLLTGARWRIGPRDLALLGTRARQLVAGAPPVGDDDLQTALDRATEGVDPADVLSLADALDDPGDLAYSPEARERFADISRLLRQLRAHAAEPLVDVVRRTITALDLDIELAVQPGARGQQSRDNIAMLIEAIADFAGNEPSASLTGALAYLRAEAEYNGGLDVAAPSDSDSVKLLTAHKAKGLEWHTVLVPFLSDKVFPQGKSRDAWPFTARELPAELRGDAASQPVVEEWSTKGVDEYNRQRREQALVEERRLGYVAFTRAKHSLVVSGHWWGRTQLEPRGPSAYLEHVRTWLKSRGAEPARWAPDPRVGEEEVRNPLIAARSSIAWPAAMPADVVQRRRQVADDVREAMRTPQLPIPVESADPDARRQLADLRALDADIDVLLEEARLRRRDVIEVPLPSSLSVTAAQRLTDDPEGLARDLARPMPRKPSAAARFGTRFHAWVESRLGQQALLDPMDLPGRADAEIDDAEELVELIEQFDDGPYATRVPYAVEAPFSLRIGAQLLRGRIDAVYRDGDRYEVVDWKTSRAATADPLQVELYRVAWAEMHGVPETDVSATFYYVRLGKVVTLEEPRGRVELERLFG
ncbi:ATP-dependent DNA helicase [Solicola gregarius]|uniref:DNA 3'-5' helicase n=1 Tax=Solicola gregarius TaxID=2908642 RepID=A0AA46YLY9_9ACTN|nr:ATP-dependent DNA helicase [Solicola gregarius]UYM06104.1 ATP-dependent helicase [Solicola gregarius]